MNIIAAVLGFLALMIMTVTGAAVAIVRMIKGPRGQAGQASEEDTRLMQEINQGLMRMEQRVEALETILLEREGKEGKQ